MTYVSNIIADYFASKTYRHPTEILVEFLTVGVRGGLGAGWYYPSELGSCLLDGTRSHPKAKFAPADDGVFFGMKHTTKVLFEGKLLDLMYGTTYRGTNWPMMGMLNKTRAVLRDGSELTQGELVKGPAIVVFNRRTKPYADIGEMCSLDLSAEAKWFLTGWWHAIWTRDGWRVYADDLNGLSRMRLALPRPRR